MKEGRKEGRNKKIYYKELTFAIMIAEKSQELQLVETQKSRWFTASLNLLKTRRANSVSCSPSLRLKAGQEQVFQLEGWQREREREFLALLFCSDFQDWMSHTHIEEGSLLYSVHQFKP